MTRGLPLAGAEPLKPLTTRLREAGALYQWLRTLLEEAAMEIERLQGARR